MRKMFLSALSLAIAGAIATQASAAVQISFINTGAPKVPTTFDASGFMTGYVGYIVRITSDAAVISAYDFGGGNNGGILGNLQQRYSSSGGDGTYDTATPGFLTFNNSASSLQNTDSHFLGVSAQLAVSVAPAENAVFPGTNAFNGKSNDSAGYGSGTSLKAAVGIQGAFQTTSVDVAYIVLPTAAVATVTNGEVSTVGGGTFLVSGTSAGVPVPEPASLGVLAMGGLALLARRRKA